MKIKNIPIKQRLELYNEALKLRDRGFGKARRISRKLNIDSWTTVHHWLKGSKPGRKASPRPPYRIPNLCPSPELSYLLGVYYGDGYASRVRRRRGGSVYLFGLEAKDKDFVEELNRSLLKLLGRKYPIKKRRENRYVVRVPNKTLYEFLKSSKGHQPIIENSPADFLRGFFDSEGTIHRCKVWLLGVYNTNFEILEYVADLLARHFSIDTHLKLSSKGGKRYPHSFESRKNCYLLVTYKRENLVKFYREIGFSIARKQRRLREAVIKRGLPLSSPQTYS